MRATNSEVRTRALDDVEDLAWAAHVVREAVERRRCERARSKRMVDSNQPR